MLLKESSENCEKIRQNNIDWVQIAEDSTKNAEDV